MSINWKKPKLIFVVSVIVIVLSCLFYYTRICVDTKKEETDIVYDDSGNENLTEEERKKIEEEEEERLRQEEARKKIEEEEEKRLRQEKEEEKEKKKKISLSTEPPKKNVQSSVGNTSTLKKTRKSKTSQSPYELLCGDKNLIYDPYNNKFTFTDVENSTAYKENPGIKEGIKTEIDKLISYIGEWGLKDEYKKENANEIETKCGEAIKKLISHIKDFGFKPLSSDFYLLLKIFMYIKKYEFLNEENDINDDYLKEAIEKSEEFISWYDKLDDNGKIDACEKIFNYSFIIIEPTKYGIDANKDKKTLNLEAKFRKVETKLDKIYEDSKEKKRQEEEKKISLSTEPPKKNVQSSVGNTSTLKKTRKSKTSQSPYELLCGDKNLIYDPYNNKFTFTDVENSTAYKENPNIKEEIKTEINKLMSDIREWGLMDEYKKENVNEIETKYGEAIKKLISHIKEFGFKPLSSNFYLLLKIFMYIKKYEFLNEENIINDDYLKEAIEKSEEFISWYDGLDDNGKIDAKLKIFNYLFIIIEPTKYGIDANKDKKTLNLEAKFRKVKTKLDEIYEDSEKKKNSI